MTAETTDNKDRADSTVRGFRRYLHPVVACVVLLAASGWWLFARDVLKWALVKQAVPWPDKTWIGQDFRLLSLPDRLGPYEKVDVDGEVFKGRDGKTDGLIDGEIIITQDILDTLGIGTDSDKRRYRQRTSNWYVSRVYRDTREPEESPYRHWQIDVTYYTGSVDAVPHIPEVCLAVGGAKPEVSSQVDWNIATVNDPHWATVPLVRAPFVHVNPLQIESRRYVQYYTFSLNGEPNPSRESVRLALTLPWVRYCYFAKIQFTPLGSISELAEADSHSQDFLKSVLPAVLANLPSKADVEKLNKGTGTQEASATRHE